MWCSSLTHSSATCIDFCTAELKQLLPCCYTALLLDLCWLFLGLSIRICSSPPLIPSNQPGSTSWRNEKPRAGPKGKGDWLHCSTTPSPASQEREDQGLMQSAEKSCYKYLLTHPPTSLLNLSHCDSPNTFPWIPGSQKQWIKASCFHNWASTPGNIFGKCTKVWVCIIKAHWTKREVSNSASPTAVKLSCCLAVCLILFFCLFLHFLLVAGASRPLLQGDANEQQLLPTTQVYGADGTATAYHQSGAKGKKDNTQHNPVLDTIQLPTFCFKNRFLFGFKWKTGREERIQSSELNSFCSLSKMFPPIRREQHYWQGHWHFCSYTQTRHGSDHILMHSAFCSPFSLKPEWSQHKIPEAIGEKRVWMNWFPRGKQHSQCLVESASSARAKNNNSGSKVRASNY